MSTRSIVGVYTECGPIGVYVHYDGYPFTQTGKLRCLSEMIQRDGASKVCQTILSSKGSWSCFEYNFKTDLSCLSYAEYQNRTEHNLMFEYIEGYGAQYKPYEKFEQSGSAAKEIFWTPNKMEEFWSCEYLYLIHPEKGYIDWSIIHSTDFSELILFKFNVGDEIPDAHYHAYI